MGIFCWVDGGICGGARLQASPTHHPRACGHSPLQSTLPTSLFLHSLPSPSMPQKQNSTMPPSQGYEETQAYEVWAREAENGGCRFGAQFPLKRQIQASGLDRLGKTVT